MVILTPLIADVVRMYLSPGSDIQFQAYYEFLYHQSTKLSSVPPSSSTSTAAVAIYLI